MLIGLLCFGLTVVLWVTIALREQAKLRRRRAWIRGLEEKLERACQTPGQIAAVLKGDLNFPTEHLSDSEEHAKLAAQDELTGSIDRRIRKRFQESAAEFGREMLAKADAEETK
jgi:hypothetical protein